MLPKRSKTFQDNLVTVRREHKTAALLQSCRTHHKRLELKTRRATHTPRRTQFKTKTAYHKNWFRTAEWRRSLCFKKKKRLKHGKYLACMRLLYYPHFGSVWNNNRLNWKLDSRSRHTFHMGFVFRSDTQRSMWLWWIGLVNGSM